MNPALLAFLGFANLAIIPIAAIYVYFRTGDFSAAIIFFVLASIANFILSMIRRLIIAQFLIGPYEEKLGMPIPSPDFVPPHIQTANAIGETICRVLSVLVVLAIYP